MRLSAAALAVLALVAVSLAGCSNVGDQDADNDGLYDSTERQGWDVTVDYMTERVRYHVTSDSSMADTDGDGIPDDEEYFLGTDPRKADTDEDGLSDCQEVRHTSRSECEDPDFFGPFDGGYGTDPKDADSDPGASLYVLNGPFTDRTGTLTGGFRPTGDGISDGEEVAGYTITLANGNTRLVRTDPRNADHDSDGLDDGEERFQFTADPTVADTDGDGCADGVDPWPDREESYLPGLGNFTLLRGGSAEVRLTLVLANVARAVPASGGVAVQQGQPTDFAAHSPGPLRPSADECRTSPRHPWVLLQVAAASGGQTLDLGSTTGPSAVGTLWWNVRDGTLSWTDDGPALPGSQAVVEGPDARLELRPRLGP